jgi:5-methylcytosine-specific restriction endonuclease McrA
MSARQILMNALGGKCAECNSITKLQLHHKDRNRKNNVLPNIVLLCINCHNKKHGPLRGKKRNIVLDSKLWINFQIYALQTTGNSRKASEKVEEAIKEYMANHPMET